MMLKIPPGPFITQTETERETRKELEQKSTVFYHTANLKCTL